ncbi:hypothetical protein GPECTOR_111g251 [Gonium pectorale]|uniref:SprT-like domain-containing protein n=1 Tax=Gonium pectorale TaxID=33097 RepID=A0A150FZA7_GONPE|nr:hypothetical protein GPECTOR_111g251 [Gonium pectorale]|eukprot:KXZ42918.1 hypothetical protein GPECTOR_111g251 [Gonium pectorale]
MARHHTLVSGKIGILELTALLSPGAADVPAADAHDEPAPQAPWPYASGAELAALLRGLHVTDGRQGAPGAAAPASLQPRGGGASASSPPPAAVRKEEEEDDLPLAFTRSAYVPRRRRRVLEDEADSPAAALASGVRPGAAASRALPEVPPGPSPAARTASPGVKRGLFPSDGSPVQRGAGIVDAPGAGSPSGAAFGSPAGPDALAASPPAASREYVSQSGSAYGSPLEGAPSGSGAFSTPGSRGTGGASFHSPGGEGEAGEGEAPTAGEAGGSSRAPSPSPPLPTGGAGLPCPASLVPAESTTSDGVSPGASHAGPDGSKDGDGVHADAAALSAGALGPYGRNGGDGDVVVDVDVDADALPASPSSYRSAQEATSLGASAGSSAEPGAEASSSPAAAAASGAAAASVVGELLKVPRRRQRQPGRDAAGEAAAGWLSAAAGPPPDGAGASGPDAAAVAAGDQDGLMYDLYGDLLLADQLRGLSLGPGGEGYGGQPAAGGYDAAGDGDGGWERAAVEEALGLPAEEASPSLPSGSQEASAWNASVFGGRLPPDLPLVWNSRLVSTAGQVVARPELRGVTRRVAAKLDLSSRVIDSLDRLRNTLSHEMCHVAAWHIDAEYDRPHGAAWEAWCRRFESAEPDLCISRTHDYAIAYAHRWRCTGAGCGKEYGRQRNTIREGVHVCSECHRPLQYLGS